MYLWCWYITLLHLRLQFDTCAETRSDTQGPGVMRRDENDAQEPGMMRREQRACAETNDSTQGLGRMHRDQCGAEDREDAQELVRAQRPVAHASDQPRRVHDQREVARGSAQEPIILCSHRCLY